MNTPEGLCISARIEKFTVSSIVSMGACYLLAVSVSSDGAAGEVDLYEGLNTAGRHIVKVKAADGETEGFVLRIPQPLEHGLYIVVNATTTHATVQWSPAPKAVEG